MEMEIRQERRGDVLTFYLTGEFNKLTAEEFDKEFATQGAGDVRLDFSGIAYLSSAGLRSILQAAKTVEMEGGEFAVLAGCAGGL